METVERRGLLAGAAGAVTALFLGRTESARAADGEPLILGARNESRSTTRLDSGASGNALEVVNASGGGALVGASGTPPEIPELPAVWAFGDRAIAAWAQSRTRAGVLGITGEYEGGVLDVRAGLWGIGGEWPGAWGQSRTDAGVLGRSDSLSGVVGVVGAGDYRSPGSDPTTPPSGVWGLGLLPGAIGAWGQSPLGIGCVGQSDHIGMWAAKGEGYDMLALEPAAFHSSARGTDVSTCARSEAGPAVMAETQTGVGVHAMVDDVAGVAIMAQNEHGGDALHTHGRVRSDAAGSGIVAAGTDKSGINPCTLVTEESHVSITFTGNPNGASAWVERLPGRGFVLHLEKAAKADLPFTYSAIDPTMPR